MEPSFTWLDLTSADRDRMRKVLDLFGEQGTVDELGLGSLRDALSDALFPGTSSIQTRLRYALFVPWIYQRLGSKGGGKAVEQEARKAEIALIKALGKSDDTVGIIGARAQETLSRLPSMVYWAGLTRWGIFLQDKSQSWYHANIRQIGADGLGASVADDPGVVWSKRLSWHPQLPKAPADFPDTAGFALSRVEAEFLRACFMARCAGSLLEHMAHHGSSTPASAFWDDPVASSAPPKVKADVELARRFSLHVEGAALLYNLVLADERWRLTQQNEDWIDKYRASLAEWAAREGAEQPFDAEDLWGFMSLRGLRVAEGQRRFVEAWGAGLAGCGVKAAADDRMLRDAVRNREIVLKKARARLQNQSRLRDWSGSAGVGRMEFRWSRVRQMMTDLHLGLLES